MVGQVNSVTENYLISLFKKYQDTGAKIIWLDNCKREPVAAIYLDRVRLDEVVISTTKTNEKYYILIDGIAVFFSYYRIVKQEE